jgi:hypothetical protein
MNNTFWVKIEDGFYRIHNGVLKYAPADTDDSSINLEEQSRVEVIGAQMLEKINETLGSNFIASDFAL